MSVFRLRKPRVWKNRALSAAIRPGDAIFM